MHSPALSLPRPRFSRTAAATQILLAGLVSLPSWPALAQSQPSEVTLPVVRTSAKREDESYRAKTTVTATKSESVLRDIPQSITIVTEALIKDQAMQGMADVTRYVPGIGMASGELNRDSPVFRGSNSASGDFYIDGLRDDVEYYRDLYNVERVEALTGPNGMIFGRGGSGGVINRATKQANWRTVRNFDLTLGSYANKRVTADVGQAMSHDMAFRLTAMAEDSEGYLRNYSLQRSGVNPTLAFRGGKDTLVVLGYEHFQDERTTDRGVPSRNGRPLDVPVDTFFGNPDPNSRLTWVRSDAVTALVEHGLAGGVRLINKTRYTDYDKFYQNYNAGAINPAAQVVPITAYNNRQQRRNFFNQTDLSVDLVAAGVTHRLLAGMELGRQDTDYLRMTGKFNDSTTTSVNVPLVNPGVDLPTTYVLGGSSSDRDGRSKATVIGLYAQDQIELSQQWQVIAGLRYDRFNLDYRNNATTGLLAPTPTSPGELSSSNGLVSPRVGVVFKPDEALTLYANYSVASFPRGGDQLSGLTAVNRGLDPERFVNYELGGKWELNPNLLTTLAVYRLNRSNVAVTNPATGIADQLVDGARTNGMELGVSGELSKGWRINGGYAYQDAKLLATASPTALAGATVQNVPRNTFSLWNRFDLTPAWGLGLGLIRRGDSYTSTSNKVVMPGYTRLDAAVFYVINAQYKVQFNVENLADRKYYMQANGDNNISPGSPRAARITLRASL